MATTKRTVDVKLSTSGLDSEGRPRRVPLAADEAGNVVIDGLTAHPDYDRWKDVMLPGEFWSTVGEKWLLDKKEPADAAK